MSRNLALGRRGTRSGAITTAPQGACWTGAGQRLVPKNADLGNRNRRQICPDCASLSGCSAERRPRSSKMERGKTEDGSAARRTIPSPAEGNESKPRRARGPLRPERAISQPRTDTAPRAAGRMPDIQRGIAIGGSALG